MTETTSELDRFFGPREHAQQIEQERLTRDELLERALKGGTQWHCEERLRLSLDAFFECWPELTPHTGEMRQMHYHAARQLVNELGELETPAFIRWASTIVSMQHRELFIKTMRSLLFLVGDWRKREQTPAWWSKPCPKCYTIHHPDGACHGEDAEEDEQ